jgi:stringent starvation protein B
MHEWMTDNGHTPLVVVDATQVGVQVPKEHIKDGRIVLNIAWSATQNLEMTNELVCFDARFSGTARSVSFPISALKAIYARESGQGMQFNDELPTEDAPDAVDVVQSSPDVKHNDKSDGDSDGRGGPRPNGPGLRLVK